MSKVRKIFEYQIWHLFAVVILIILIKVYASNNPEIFDGALWGINTSTWFWLAIAIPILHQIYVWLIWRLELYTKLFTKRYGPKTAFKLYSRVFSILFVGRLISIIILACSNKNSLNVEPVFAYALSFIIIIPVIYLFYSVKRYFTVERAYGIDHFDKNYNEPFVKKGIFKFTNNGMYVYGLMILYLPGLLLTSEAALLVALFNHVYIWVHYFFTEKPDMVAIYGKTP